MRSHTVEKIGGTSMSRFKDVLDNVLVGNRKESELYQRIIVVSAYAGLTDLLLEHKKTREPGVYGLFVDDNASSWAWGDAITKVGEKMLSINAELEPLGLDLDQADLFVKERIEGVRSCLLDLHRLCSYGHFQLSEHLLTIRELLSAIGEAHSAYNTTMILQDKGVNARFMDLTGWREEENLGFTEKIKKFFDGTNYDEELPIVTGYTQCKEGLMHTYDRGYSEITFSKVAVVTQAREAIIHKEFHLSSADPKMVGEDKVQTIGHTNYDVADQLADLGMEAIHPGAAKGLRNSGIDLRIKNTFEPDHPGTLITNDYVSESPCVEIIAGRTGLTEVRFMDQDMVGLTGYDQKLCKDLDDKDLRYVAKTTSANTIVHYLPVSMKRAGELVRSWKRQFPEADIDMGPVAMVSPIGSNMATPGLMASATRALDEAGVYVIAMQKDRRNVEAKFIVPESDLQQTVKVLHQVLVEECAI
ncbi:aspartate kinase [Desulfatibacillum alkenivorans DSM 16219]|jgi:aspartate kinase|uniref:aspartate kinase n=1 Tax=Desulfatibacillum alkenivorans DSM 16219 TaxID=1121393 RepID=A0A1M6PS95_9BACT|nr:aspartate kinase [Desulfatibacillum alkenivorans]SHK10834.1 aspartate kinase [Desulfatibacillum alkenivorans DSM 16219]